MFCVKGCHVFCYLAKLSYCSIILLIFFEFLIAKFQNCTFCLFPRCFHLSIEIRTVFVFALRPFLPMSVHGISFAKLSQIFVLSDKNPILNTHFSTLKNVTGLMDVLGSSEPNGLYHAPILPKICLKQSNFLVEGRFCPTFSYYEIIERR